MRDPGNGIDRGATSEARRKPGFVLSRSRRNAPVAGEGVVPGARASRFHQRPFRSVTGTPELRARAVVGEYAPTYTAASFQGEVAMRPLISAAAVSLALGCAPVLANPDAACEGALAATTAPQGVPAPIAAELPAATAATPDFDQAVAAAKCGAMVAGASAAVGPTPAAPGATVVAPVPGAAASTTSTASVAVPAAPGTPATPAATTTPGQAAIDPSTYQPKTEFDNTPWRFNMEQDGKRMTADEFTAWMEARGVRVAKGAARPVGAQNPAGDGRPPNWSAASAGQVGETATGTPGVAPAAAAAATESVAVPAAVETPVDPMPAEPAEDGAEAPPPPR
jgi:hypothetical protein